MIGNFKRFHRIYMLNSSFPLIFLPIIKRNISKMLLILLERLLRVFSRAISYSLVFIECHHLEEAEIRLGAVLLEFAFRALLRRKECGKRGNLDKQEVIYTSSDQSQFCVVPTNVDTLTQKHNHPSVRQPTKLTSIPLSVLSPSIEDELSIISTLVHTHSIFDTIYSVFRPSILEHF